MIVLWVAGAILVALLLRAPVWVLGALLSLAVLLTVGVLWLGGVERAITPIVLAVIALGLLVPATVQSARSSRVAPARRRPRRPADGRTADGTGSQQFEAADVPGYSLLEKVGSGGMASVYRARRLSDDQVVALKIPMEQYVADAKFIRRFHREAEVAQRLNHRNIVRTFEHGAVGVQHYMVMEFVDGRSLEGYIEGHELDIPLSVEIMRLVVRALQHIHSAGIIHRDIKPANVMITRGGIEPGDGSKAARLRPDAVKLMDFGIAGGKVLSRLTMTGARVGTPVYMSPEQARGLKIDHRSDIYSLGLVFYEMLTGQTAFKGGYEAIVHQQIFQTPPPPRQVDLRVPKALDQLVMRMIAKDADERPTLDEVYDTLEDVDFEADDAGNLPTRLLLTVSARQGVLRILDPDGNLHTSIGDIGVGSGNFSAAPLAVSVDSGGDVFAAIFEYRVGQQSHKMIHKLAPDGTVKTSFGPYGMQPGEFLYPLGLAVAPDDTVYVLDSETFMVSRFSNDGRFIARFGGRGKGHGTFDDPRAVAVDWRGSVYVLDYGNRQVQRLSADGDYQTRWAFKVSAEQPGLRLLDGMTVDADCNVYISDASAGKVRKVTADGKVGVSFNLDARQGEGTDTLVDLGVDDSGYLYVARRGGHLIRKFDPAGRLMETFETYAPLVQMVVDVRERSSEAAEAEA
ncbi:MAG: protein kinase [Truepera sp.]|jgi:serine/threonine-protein kinase|nr:protein kinase [Truepera sp.]